MALYVPHRIHQATGGIDSQNHSLSLNLPCVRQTLAHVVRTDGMNDIIEIDPDNGAFRDFGSNCRLRSRSERNQKE